MAKLSTIPRDKRILLQGVSRSGKTHFIGTLCQFLPTLVVTSDVEGLETLATMGLDTEVVKIEEWGKCWDYYTEIAKLAPDFKAIALDDFGAVQATARRKIESMPRGYKEEMDKQFTTTVKRELMRGERTLEIRDWGKIWVALETFLYSILTLQPAVKVVTTLESPDDDIRTGEPRLYPNLQGAIRHSLPARFGIVAEAFYTKYKDNFYYCISCKPHPRVATGDRYGSGRTWVDPTATKVLAYMNGKGEPESEIERAIGVGL